MAERAYGWTQETIAEFFAPGERMELVPRRRKIFEPRSVHRSQVLGTQEDDLVLSFPKPPLETPLLGQPLEITFLCREETGPKRYGY
ncbi:MAG: hypothetical protein PVG60_07430, partial [Desulfarculaceae bacterium]